VWPLDIGFETIGNATIIAYDEEPVFVTDPWIQGAAYFGSWTQTHAIPDEQRRAILACPVVWFSHGHPDHLNADSLPLFKDKRILLPDHVGGRMATELKQQGYRVEILRDRTWVPISKRVKVMCIADLGQDSVLLIDINGRLLVNTNDCGENGWGWFVRRIVKKYATSFLLSLSGYGDADMNNFYDENGKFLTPEPMLRKPFGDRIAEATEKMGTRYFAVSSSLHCYQRTDSVWANAMVADLDAYGIGFHSNRCELLPAFIRFHCGEDRWEKINPPANEIRPLAPEIFGDSWAERLKPEDLSDAKRYFNAVECLQDGMSFIRLKVGGETHSISLGDSTVPRGVTFEAPRASLMTAIRCEVFDDMLIGNFMKTTLHGVWPALALHPYFTAFVGKYADNGRAKKRAEVAAYKREYERRSFRLKLLRLQNETKTKFRESLGESSLTVRLAKKIYRGLVR